MQDVSTHKNEEQVIRYYLGFLPPKGLGSILNIGGGPNDPYGGMLKTRCSRYMNIDIRPGRKVHKVIDITERTEFQEKEWDWGWCTEVLEHLPPTEKLNSACELMRICKNITFTYPTPSHESFLLDPGHTEVKINWQSIVDLDKGFTIEDHTTKNGRAIIILKGKDFKTPDPPKEPKMKSLMDFNEE
jgi:hypothetical protein